MKEDKRFKGPTYNVCWIPGRVKANDPSKSESRNRAIEAYLSPIKWVRDYDSSGAVRLRAPTFYEQLTHTFYSLVSRVRSIFQ